MSCLLCNLLQFVLHLLGDHVPIALRSGGSDLERPLSEGKQTYSTDKSEWPLTEPMTKRTAKLQVCWPKNNTISQQSSYPRVQLQKQTCWIVVVVVVFFQPGIR